MEKNATVYVVELGYQKLMCPDKKSAMKLFEELSGIKASFFECLSYEKYYFPGKGLRVTLKAYIIDLYSCREEARVTMKNEETLIEKKIMEDNRKKTKIKEIKT